MNAKPSTRKGRRGTGAILLEFLGSMNLAITLLVALAIASVIGTVLQQNQAFNSYIMKFGPFWFEVFKSLGLYDIYGAGWFLALLGFLLVSTAVCVYRNTPAILRDMQQFRLDARYKSLRNFRHSAEWQTEVPADVVLQRGAQYLQSRGYRVRRRDHDDHSLLGGMRGAFGRLAYIVTHAAIVVICLGGLIDGNVPLQYKQLTGEVVPETRDIPVSELPDRAVLSPGENSAFRGSVSIPEGSRTDFTFLSAGNGYLVQELPFTIELKDFRVEHYASGQPKSFESDLVVHDPERDEPLEKTIAVNEPLLYKGYAVYQSSFSDGGTGLKLEVWPLRGADAEPMDVVSRVHQSVRLETDQGRYTAEFTNFKAFNVFPSEKEGEKFRNFGPSIVYKLRRPSGEAREFVTYVAPVTLEGHPYYVSGVRANAGEPYRYLYIPVGPEGGIDQFMRLRARAQDDQRVREAVVQQLGEDADNEQLATAIVDLVQLFAQEGADAVIERIRASFGGADEGQRVVQAYIGLLQRVYGKLYVELLREQGVDVEGGMNDEQARFFDDAMNALSVVGPYGAPVYLQPVDYQQVQASGLQITRSPGKNVVYLGCAMLMVGVFLMFYIRHRRVWLWVAAEGGVTRILLAGHSDRERVDFGPEFEQMSEEVGRLMELPTAPSTEP
ncbi:MAG TPA: cytochrome c biogenesis protein ResB [Gammaproteobacteria bacterium]|nr:cytochrome c biogenesis protein ResB [Gammaproteobacteria bacterium]